MKIIIESNQQPDFVQHNQTMQQASFAVNSIHTIKPRDQTNTNNSLASINLSTNFFNTDEK